jgi:hypothetical protein
MQGNVSDSGYKPVRLCGTDSGNGLKLVIVGDGYTRGELPEFRSDARAVKEMILGTPPFDGMSACIVRLDIPSPESSAYRSAGDRSIDTYFGWRFDERERHLLDVDKDKVVATVRAALPAHWGEHKILVLVNAPEVFAGGGMFSPHSDGRVTGIAMASNANGCETIMHELGHAFGLADEYAASPNMGNSPPNIASDPVKLPAFWQARLTANVERPTPGAARDVVGAFAASRGPAHFRPQYSCIMKTASSFDRYCRVCADWIQAAGTRTRSPERKAVR